MIQRKRTVLEERGLTAADSLAIVLSLILFVIAAPCNWLMILCCSLVDDAAQGKCCCWLLCVLVRDLPIFILTYCQSLIDSVHYITLCAL